jgi:hypothetical protein
MRWSRFCLSTQNMESASQLLRIVSRVGMDIRELRIVFDMIDLDHNEFIERSEMRSLVSSSFISEEELDKVFGSAKSASARVGFGEFAAFISDCENLLISEKLVSSCRVLFVSGGPGSGKGTVCSLLTKRNPALKHVSAGDLLRDEIRSVLSFVVCCFVNYFVLAVAGLLWVSLCLRRLLGASWWRRRW